MQTPALRLLDTSLRDAAHRPRIHLHADVGRPGALAAADSGATTVNLPDSAGRPGTGSIATRCRLLRVC